MKRQVQCPGCGGSPLRKVTFKKSNEIFYYCEDCDTTYDISNLPEARWIGNFEEDCEKRGVDFDNFKEEVEEGEYIEFEFPEE